MNGNNDWWSMHAKDAEESHQTIDIVNTEHDEQKNKPRNINRMHNGYEKDVFRYIFIVLPLYVTH